MPCAVSDMVNIQLPKPAPPCNACTCHECRHQTAAARPLLPQSNAFHQPAHAQESQLQLAAAD